MVGAKKLKSERGIGAEFERTDCRSKLYEMHVYNAWLPPPVRELLEADPERNKFHDVVLEVEREWQLHSAESRFASLKWISVINTYVCIFFLRCSLILARQSRLNELDLVKHTSVEQARVSNHERRDPGYLMHPPTEPYLWQVERQTQRRCLQSKFLILSKDNYAGV